MAKVPSSLQNPDQNEGMADDKIGWRKNMKVFVVRDGKEFNYITENGREMLEAGDELLLDPKSAALFGTHLYDKNPDKETPKDLLPPAGVSVAATAAPVGAAATSTGETAPATPTVTK